MSEATPLGSGGDEIEGADDDVGIPETPARPRRYHYPNRPRPLLRKYRVGLDAKPINGWKVGDQVRVVRISPWIATITEETSLLPNTVEVFQNIVGQTLRIDGFYSDQLELNVFDDGSQANNYCHNTIMLEPECAIFARRSPVLPSEWERRLVDKVRQKRRLLGRHERHFERRWHQTNVTRVRKFGERKW